MDYKATLNMPKSGFPMRAGLPKREPEMLKHWEEMDLYNVMLKKNEGKPRFALHDGPPFSNGGLHMGHALNKSLKDFITRSYAMRGYYTPYIPGWDNHGMPIESAIIKEQKLNRKAMSVADFRTACHAGIQIAALDEPEGFAYGVGRGSAGGNGSKVHALEAGADGDVPGGHVADHHGDEENGNPLCAFFEEFLVFLLKGLHPADAAADDDADPVGVKIL